MLLDYDKKKEELFFSLFQRYFDSEKDAGKQHDPANYTLERMRPLAEMAGHPEEALKIIHIAGTKGKGTTSAYVEALLRSAGKTTGLFTSPHIRTVRERFQLNGKLVSYDQLIATGKTLLAKLEKTDLTPSLFEIFTVLALRLFADAKVEYAILETGIGGRVDSTNYVSHPLCSIITPVSFDHMALLGNTIEAIAQEKAGIIKPRIPIIVAKQPYQEARQVIEQRASDLHSPLIPLLPLQECQPFSLLSSQRQGIPPFLQENFLTALTAVHALEINPDPQTFIPPEFRARFEVIQQKPLVMLDGAHNGDSIERLVEALRLCYPTVTWTIVLGIVKGKDIPRILQAFKKLPLAQFILTNPDTGKGSALSELSELCLQYNLPVLDIIPELTNKEQLPPQNPLLFTGSFFTALIGEKLFRS